MPRAPRPRSRRSADDATPALPAYEIHHRVKNNLQVIASILRLQIRRETSEDARQALAGAINRILGMAVVHDLLAQEGGRRVHFKEFLQRIIGLTLETYAHPGQTVRSRVEGAPITLDVDVAIPLAVAANELIINTMKHAFRDRTEGGVVAVLRRDGGMLEVTIADDGAGLPPAFLLYDQSHLGLRIVRGIVQDDLKGQFFIESPGRDRGTTATMRVTWRRK
jgi:two-component sensor histidine kinase